MKRRYVCLLGHPTYQLYPLHVRWTYLESNQLQCLLSGNFLESCNFLSYGRGETWEVDGSSVGQELFCWDVLCLNKVADCDLGGSDPCCEFEFGGIEAISDWAECWFAVEGFSDDTRDES
jgi:hypothetical protein